MSEQGIGWECPRCTKIWAPYVPFCNCQGISLADMPPMTQQAARDWAIRFLEQVASHLSNLGPIGKISVEERPQVKTLDAKWEVDVTDHKQPEKGPSIVMGAQAPADAAPKTQAIIADPVSDEAGVGEPGGHGTMTSTPKQQEDCGCAPEITPICTSAFCPRGARGRK